MDKKDICETRYCVVTFDETNKQKYYSYKTFFGDLTSKDVIYVDTPKGIKGVSFRGYVDKDDNSTAFTEEEKEDFRSKANKWILGKINTDDIDSFINIAETKSKIKRCIQRIEKLKNSESKTAARMIFKYKEQLNSLLEEYSKLI